MYKTSENRQASLDDFDQPIGLHMNPDNRWVRLAEYIPWEKFEHKYAGQFRSKPGNVAKPFRMALGSLIIQKKLGFSDRELVEEITENPYLQYFIGLPGYQQKPPFDPSVLVAFRYRMKLDVMQVINEAVLRQYEEQQQENAEEKSDDDHHSTPGSGSGNDATAPEDSQESSESENSGTLILDATCAPSNIRYPQDFSLLNEAREKLEDMIRRICRSTDRRMPRTYCREARKNYLNLAKSRKKSAAKVRKVLRKQLGYIERDLRYLKGYIAEGYVPTAEERRLLDTIRTLYDQQKYMYDNHKHKVADRIVSIEQPYIRPIVRGKTKAPVEFGVKFDLSLDEYGMGRIEKISFDPYNESGVLIQAVEAYRSRTGHYPGRILADQIYRNRENRAFCKEHGIRISGPKLGRRKQESYAIDKKIEYQDNTDRIEVERAFSLCKRSYGLGLIRTKRESTTYGAIGLSVFVRNLFRILTCGRLFFFASFTEMAEKFFWPICMSKNRLQLA
jgi:hypothetical protein